MSTWFSFNHNSSFADIADRWNRWIDELYDRIEDSFFNEISTPETQVTWSSLNANSSISNIVGAVQVLESDSFYARGFGGFSDGTSFTRQFVVGNFNDEILATNSGNDVLISRSGNDTLTGGPGADSFVFLSSTNDGIDTITDFDVSEDRIVVSASGFEGLTPPPLGEDILLTPDQFSLGSSATTDGVSFIYNPNDGILAYDADGIGSQAQVSIAQLSSNLDFTYQNIQVVA